MQSVDPFTRASATYQNSMRHPHKTGAAWEGYTPRRPAFARIAGRVFVLASLALFAAFLVDVMRPHG